jgi:hypothetical protein
MAHGPDRREPMKPAPMTPQRVGIRRLAVPAVVLACAWPAAQAAGSWLRHPADFPTSPLCQAGEVALWSCTARHKTFSLCADRGAVGDDFAIQYRVRDRAGKLVLRYPQPPRAPRSAFAYLVSANGDAEVDFTIGPYHYALVDPLRDRSFITVDQGGKELSHLRCAEGNQSLQLNDTMALMKALGVPEPQDP